MYRVQNINRIIIEFGSASLRNKTRDDFHWIVLRETAIDSLVLKIRMNVRVCVWCVWHWILHEQTAAVSLCACVTVRLNVSRTINKVFRINFSYVDRKCVTALHITAGNLSKNILSVGSVSHEKLLFMVIAYWVMRTQLLFCNFCASHVVYSVGINTRNCDE